eukprot:TRINITY_DN18976_c0_g1_i1.p2 TRINITY_DN18976_c0_g1~~TRINITY_DN18976_c0_g1_i1.p2  ORF type:complete len:172 (+),score=6.73 TRINITY_DN18976_c0_g1_i1:210-725(+)
MHLPRVLLQIVPPLKRLRALRADELAAAGRVRLGRPPPCASRMWRARDAPGVTTIPHSVQRPATAAAASAAPPLPPPPPGRSPPPRSPPTAMTLPAERPSSPLMLWRWCTPCTTPPAYSPRARRGRRGGRGRPTRLRVGQPRSLGRDEDVVGCPEPRSDDGEVRVRGAGQG